MKLLRFITVFLVLILALANNVWAEETEDPSKQAAEPNTLLELDAGVKDNGELVRKTRQFRTFGFGRPFYGGGFYRPYYGGGFYRPRPFYGGGFYRPYYGGFYRPYYRPFGYGGFYG